MNVKIYYFLIVAFWSLGLNAQTFDSIANRYAETITAEELKKHLEVIASDEYEGRETGRKGQKMAKEYLVNQFRSYGIKPHEGKYVQEFDLIEQKGTGVKLSIKEREFSINEDFIFSPSIIKKTTITAQAVFIGFGISNLDELELKDKAVLFIKKVPKNIGEELNLNERVKLIKEKGAAIVMVYDPDVDILLEKYQHYYTRPRMKLTEEVKEDVPFLRINREVLNAFSRNSSKKLNWDKLLKKGCKKLIFLNEKISLEVNKPTEDLISENILAYIPGSEKKEELLVITAHYDHIGKRDSLIYNGADDDGTGTVALLELAQAFMAAKNEGHTPKRSILIMPVSGEEKGLLGSYFYSEHPVFDLNQTVTNLNVDMIGRYDKSHENDSNYIYLIGSDKLSKDLHSLSETVNQLYCNIDFDYTYNDENDPNRFYYRSDHYNFAKNNVPVIFYFSGVHEDYHKPTDTIEKIDYKKTERIAKLIFYTAWHIANRDERIQLD